MTLVFDPAYFLTNLLRFTLAFLPSYGAGIGSLLIVKAIGRAFHIKFEADY